MERLSPQERYEENKKVIISMIEEITMGPLGTRIKDERTDIGFGEVYEREYAYNGEDILLIYKDKGVCDRNFKKDIEHQILYNGKKYSPENKDDNQIYITALTSAYVEHIFSLSNIELKEEKKNLKIK